jgi:3-phosphoshikimate 1-carboxyvinyltransferase
MQRVAVPLKAMGATITSEGEDGLPLTVRGGALRAFSYHTPVASAQIKAALLFAGVSGNVPVTVSEPAKSRDHSERLFAHLGFDVHTHGTTVELRGVPESWPAVPNFSLEIPGDASSSAFLVGAATLADGGEILLRSVGVNPTRTGFLEVLTRMGGHVHRLDERDVCGEPVADLVVRPATLRGVTVGPNEIPALIDEIPMLAVLASRAEGESRFREVGELRVKESDRLGLLAENLRAIGVRAAVEDNDLVVVGSDQPPRGRVETGGDHRLGMAFAVLGTTAGGTVELSETRSAAVSYPDFFSDLTHIGSHE